MFDTQKLILKTFGYLGKTGCKSPKNNRRLRLTKKRLIKEVKSNRSALRLRDKA